MDEITAALETMSTHQELLNDVYGCQTCPAKFGFARPGPDQPFYKFPPTIGALGRARILFVGINPRLTPDNERLHNRVMASFSEFCLLADNRDDGQSYIAPGCQERHYHWHVEVVQKFFGSSAKFEDYAAVTELFFCATGNSKNLGSLADSPCASKYFERVFLKVRPMIVVPRWESVLNYFQNIAGEPDKRSFFVTLGGHSALVVDITSIRRY